jgi:hypothetical protein
VTISFSTPISDIGNFSHPGGFVRSQSPPQSPFFTSPTGANHTIATTGGCPDRSNDAILTSESPATQNFNQSMPYAEHSNFNHAGQCNFNHSGGKQLGPLSLSTKSGKGTQSQTGQTYRGKGGQNTGKSGSGNGKGKLKGPAHDEVKGQSRGPGQSIRGVPNVSWKR